MELGTNLVLTTSMQQRAANSLAARTCDEYLNVVNTVVSTGPLDAPEVNDAHVPPLACVHDRR